ncbi:MAG: nucleoside triphosphate pyrophosphohydrolase [Candidatus Doudnabacteria bacterium]|nr:nucleoside triphosphate pyrophosphohydrolase [Candidatus Doudnabacteria bacterium]
MNLKPTSYPKENELPKLVRDNIPTLYQKRAGKIAQTRIAKSDTEYLKYLLKKVTEEATEVKHSLKHNNLLEEIADVYEVIEAILKLKGWSLKDVKKIQNSKREKNGGFNKRIILLTK